MRARPIILALALAVTALAPAVARADGPTDVAGVPASLVGRHGPTQNVATNLELVGHTDMPTRLTNGDVVPLGNNGAPALIGDCAYVGRWHDYSAKRGVQIVDIADPSAPRVVGNIAATKTSGVAREIRAVDLPNVRLLIVLLFSQAIGDRSNNKIQFYTVPADDCTAPHLAGTYDMRAFRGHEFYLWLDAAHPVNGSPRVLVFVTAPVGPPNMLIIDATDPANPMLAGAYDAGMPVLSASEEAGTYLGTYAHSVSLSPDGAEAYISYWDGGFFTVDSSDFAAGLPAGAIRPKGAMSTPLRYPTDQPGNTHSAVKIPGTNTIVAGDEIYISTDGCPFGFMRTFDIGDTTTPPRQIGEFRLAENDPRACTDVAFGPPDATGARQVMRAANVRNADGTFSMHNQTVLTHFAFATWYGAGLRVIDVSDPARPRESGSFVPQPVERIANIPDTSAPTYGRDDNANNDWWVATWSYPIIRDGLIYLTDVRNGLYILKPTPDASFAAEVAATRFAEGNSNLGDLLR